MLLLLVDILAVAKESKKEREKKDVGHFREVSFHSLLWLNFLFSPKKAVSLEDIEVKEEKWIKLTFGWFWKVWKILKVKVILFRVSEVEREKI